MNSKRIIHLINNERLKMQASPEKGCDSTSMDHCYSNDTVECFVYSTDICYTKDWYTCVNHSADVCIDELDTAPCMNYQNDYT